MPLNTHQGVQVSKMWGFYVVMTPLASGNNDKSIHMYDLRFTDIAIKKSKLHMKSCLAIVPSYSEKDLWPLVKSESRLLSIMTRSKNIMNVSIA